MKYLSKNELDRPFVIAEIREHRKEMQIKKAIENAGNKTQDWKRTQK